ncbi:olfactomedin-4 isoform X1 [Callorhinchus milii]|uniref:olfactomedin-4 isoform X1 n=1 Tax=Callorhinchus milii TaxID=7868 RepID=UPI001C3F71F5|nr:olfactomedin-4 isoform X1 [Callorhinchus milii]
MALCSFLCKIGLCFLLQSAVNAVGSVGRSRVAQRCYCDLEVPDGLFPVQQLNELHRLCVNCTRTLAGQEFDKAVDIVVSLEQRLTDLQQRINEFEEEYEGGLYSIISFRIIEIEITELHDLFQELQEKYTSNQNDLSGQIVQIVNITDRVDELQKYDRQNVVQEQRENARLRRSLSSCNDELLRTVAPPTTPHPGSCSFGALRGVSEPRSSILSHYGTSYFYGGWGNDPLPAAGKENQYWLAIMLKSNYYGNVIRIYPSFGTFLSKTSHTDVTIPGTHIQGTGGIMYENCFYFNCYNSPKLCKFNMTAKTVLSDDLPFAGHNNKFPYCRPSSCLLYTDIDLATDENGLWALYATESNFGNTVISLVNTSDLSLIKSWNTTLYKKSATNAFMVCGVMYATRFFSDEMEEIFYMFDTTTEVELNNLSIRFRKVSSGIQHINYNPRDQKLYVYSDAFLVTHDIIFG